jgi:hypothetical protein
MEVALAKTQKDQFLAIDIYLKYSNGVFAEKRDLRKGGLSTGDL